ncbi:MAG: hypothetical protein H6672_21360 [Anaerolineaceae bacterium]|nr:hypothetical protein [Anaerolineaceae bacterium]
MPKAPPEICVVGVGDGGSAALNRILDQGLHGIASVMINTYSLALSTCRADWCIQIGTHGMGSGGIPQAGQQAAEASVDDLYFALRGAAKVFIVAGMGGGTGTGAAPVVARVASDLGAETVGVVSYPFTFEGIQRQHVARKGMRRLQQVVSTLVEVEGDRLLRFAHNREIPSLEQAFTLMAGALAWHVLARMI